MAVGIFVGVGVGVLVGIGIGVCVGKGVGVSVGICVGVLGGILMEGIRVAVGTSTIVTPSEHPRIIATPNTDNAVTTLIFFHILPTLARIQLGVFPLENSMATTDQKRAIPVP